MNTFDYQTQTWVEGENAVKLRQQRERQVEHMTPNNGYPPKEHDLATH